ncbi:MAG: hypothetical protein H7Z37_04025 [Pyrinomonadaceae bacterium]|nr:hypothetical protein [Pyrinomonadaceae bacterium]
MSRRNLFLVSSIILVGLFFSIGISAQTGIKIVKRTQMQIPGMPYIDPGQAKTGNAKKAIDKVNAVNAPKRETVYIKNQRMRTDSDGVSVVGGMLTRKMVDQVESNIVQCDKQRSIRFNSRKKKYFVTPFDAGSSTANSGKTAASVQSGKGFINVTNTVTDTGERMKLFGYDARHLKQTIIFDSSKSSCKQGNMKMEIDGWYADVPEFSCPLKSETTEMPDGGGCNDEFRVTNKGVKLSGVALKEITTMTMDGQKDGIVRTSEVVELTKTPLEASLFEPPAGYSPANNKAEISDDDSNASSNQQNNQPNNYPTNYPASMPDLSGGNYTANPTLAPPNAGTGEQKTVAPKKAGTIRIGVLSPQADFTQTKSQQKTGEMTDNSQLIQAAFVKALTNQNVEAVALSGGAVFEAKSEAAQLGCDYILVSSLTKKKGGSMFSQIIPMVAGAIIPGADLLGRAIKAKDKVTLEYQLVKAEQNAPMSNGKLESRAAKDGEDIITPMISQSSTAILSQVKKP